MEIKNKVLISITSEDLIKGVFENKEVTEVANNCFSEMSDLKKVILPKVKKIGNDCFRYNGSLTTVTLPALTTAGNYCFRYNGSLTIVTLPALTTAENYCFRYNGSLTTVTLPALTTAGNYCFSSNDKLTTVELPALTTAENYCFRYNGSLTTVTLPALTTAGNDCFSSNDKLTTVELPALTTAGNDCFRSNDKLTTVELPALTTAGNYCFSYNGSLTCILLRKIKLSVKNVDGYCYVITVKKTSKGIKIYAGYNLINVNKNIVSKQELFVAEKGNFTAHGITVKKAIQDLQFKIVSETLKNKPIEKDTVITVNYYRLITGACEIGANSWIDSVFNAKERKNVIDNGILAKDLLPILKANNAYGLSRFINLITFK